MTLVDTREAVDGLIARARLSLQVSGSSLQTSLVAVCMKSESCARVGLMVVGFASPQGYVP